MNAVGLMAPHVGLLTAPAAQVALVQSLTPLLAAAFGVVVLREGLRGSQWLGLVLGPVGVGLVVGEAALESTIRFQGLVLAFVGVLGLVAGTLYFGRFCRSVPPLAGATAQFLSAAVVASLCPWRLETPYAEWTDIRHYGIAAIQRPVGRERDNTHTFRKGGPEPNGICAVLEHEKSVHQRLGTLSANAWWEPKHSRKDR
jgi:drug/metabolite transporter (DMT)-like permease